MKKKIGISIRLQLIMGFAIPIIFIVMVGMTSYNQASKSLITNYTSSSMNTIHMTTRSLDDS